MNLILNSRFVFTDDEVYKFYSAKRDKYSILLEKVENNSKTNENDILRNRINSLIKNC